MADPYTVVKEFEQTIADYCGAKYGVAVSSCCNAIFLCLRHLKFPGFTQFVFVPKYTYPGVAMSIVNAGYVPVWSKNSWNGVYKINPTKIVDGALRFKKDMYEKNTFHCLSFHSKKHIPIGRGGMILSDDKTAVSWLKRARFDGREQCALADQKDTSICGWNMYMTPEQAARGLVLFNNIKDKDLPDIPVEEQGYPDLSTWRCFK